MVERTFELLVTQLAVFLAGVPQDMSKLIKWALKVGKSYKALRIMEVHKTAEPKFARTLKTLHPYLKNLKVSDVDENHSLDDSQIFLPTIGEDGGIILQGGYGIDESILDSSFANNKSISTGQL